MNDWKISGGGWLECERKLLKGTALRFPTTNPNHCSGDSSKLEQPCLLQLNVSQRQQLQPPPSQLSGHLPGDVGREATWQEKRPRRAELVRDCVCVMAAAGTWKLYALKEVQPIGILCKFLAGKSAFVAPLGAVVGKDWSHKANAICTPSKGLCGAWVQT